MADQIDRRAVRGWPQSAVALAEIIGVEATRALVGAYGGRDCTVPVSAHPDYQLARVIGIEALERLVEHHAGCKIDVPTLHYTRTKKELIAAATGSHAAIARRFGCSVRWVQQVRGAQGVTKETVPGVEHWEGVCAELRERLAEASGKAADLAATRRALILPAKTGDEAAVAELDRQDEQLDTLQREVRDLEEAVADAEALLTEAREAAAAEERVQRQAQAAELDRQAAEVAGRVDEALAAIAGYLSEMRQLMAQADPLRGDGEKPKAPMVAFENVLRGASWSGAMAHHGRAARNSVHRCFLRSFREGIFGAAPADVAGEDAAADEADAA